MIVSKSMADHRVGVGHMGSVSRCGKRKSRRSEPMLPDGFVLLQEEEPLNIPEPENKKLTEYRDAPASPPPSDAVNELSPFDDEASPSSPPPFLQRNNERLPNELLDEICSDMGIKDSMDLDFVEFLMDQQVPQFSANTIKVNNRMYKTRDGSAPVQPGMTTLPQQIAVTSSQSAGYSESSSSSGSPVSKRFHLAPPSSGTSPNKEQVQSVSSTSVLNTPIKLNTPPTPSKIVSCSTPLPSPMTSQAYQTMTNNIVSNCSTDQQKINQLMMQQQRMENAAQNGGKMRCHTPSNMSLKTDESTPDSTNVPPLHHLPSSMKMPPRNQQQYMQQQSQQQQFQQQQYNSYQQQQQQQQQAMPPPVVNVNNMQRPNGPYPNNMVPQRQHQQCNNTNRPPNMTRLGPHPIQSYQKPMPGNNRNTLPRYMHPQGPQGPCSPLDRGYYSSETNSVRSFASSSSSTGITVLNNPTTTSNASQNLSSPHPNSMSSQHLPSTHPNAMPSTPTVPPTMSNSMPGPTMSMSNSQSQQMSNSMSNSMTQSNSAQMSNSIHSSTPSQTMSNSMQNSVQGHPGQNGPGSGPRSGHLGSGAPGSGSQPGHPMSNSGRPVPNAEQGLLAVAPPHNQSQNPPGDASGAMYPQQPNSQPGYNFSKNPNHLPTSCMKANYPEISPHSYLLRNCQQQQQQQQGQVPQNCGPYNNNSTPQSRLPPNLPHNAQQQTVPYETDFNANEQKSNKMLPKMSPYVKPEFNVQNMNCPPGMMMPPYDGGFPQNNPDVIPNASPLTYTDLDMPNMSPYPHPQDFNRNQTPQDFNRNQPQNFASLQQRPPISNIESAASDFTVMTDGPMTVPTYADESHLGPAMLHGAYGSAISQPSPRIAAQGPFTPCDPSMMQSSREFGMPGEPGGPGSQWGNNPEGTAIPGAYGKPPDLLCQPMPGMPGASSPTDFISPPPHACTGVECLECKASLSLRSNQNMSSQQRFIQNLITDRSNAFRSHPLYPLLRDLIIADMNFNSPHFPYQLISNLPRDFDKLLHNFLHRNPPTGNYQGNYAVESVVMDALRYAHSCLIEKIKSRRDEDETTKTNSSSKSLSAIEEFCEKFDRAVRNMSGPEPSNMGQGGMSNGMMHDTGVMPLPSNNGQMPPPSMYGMSPMKKPMDMHPAMMQGLSMHQAYQEGYLSSDNGSGYSNQSNKSESKKHPSLPKESVAIMLEWLRSHKDNPYPNDDEKAMLIKQTGLTINQINYWFTNARRRILPKWAQLKT